MEYDAVKSMEWTEAWSWTPKSVWKHHTCTITKQRRTKLDDRSAKFVLISYDSRTKGYKLYDPCSGTVNRDVEFDEERTWE